MNLKISDDENDEVFDSKESDKGTTDISTPMSSAQNLSSLTFGVAMQMGNSGLELHILYIFSIINLVPCPERVVFKANYINLSSFSNYDQILSNLLTVW